MFVVGEDGTEIVTGDVGDATTPTPDDPAGRTGRGTRQPDNNGIDDPPVAVDDPVTARVGLVGPGAGDGERLRPRRRGDRRVRGRACRPWRRGDPGRVDGRLHTRTLATSASTSSTTRSSTATAPKTVGVVVVELLPAERDELGTGRQRPTSHRPARDAGDRRGPAERCRSRARRTEHRLVHAAGERGRTAR